LPGAKREGFLLILPSSQEVKQTFNNEIFFPPRPNDVLATGRVFAKRGFAPKRGETG
jgi:hypothetical protein